MLVVIEAETGARLLLAIDVPSSQIPYLAPRSKHSQASRALDPHWRIRESQIMISKLAFILVTVGLLFPTWAHAYLDPATGSIILQMVMGGVAGAALLMKLYWHRFLGLFGGGQKDDESSN